MIKSITQQSSVAPEARITLPEMTDEQREAAKCLIRQWAEDESGYDEQVWPLLKTSIEANRLSERERFVD